MIYMAKLNYKCINVCTYTAYKTVGLLCVIQLIIHFNFVLIFTFSANVNSLKISMGAKL